MKKSLSQRTEVLGHLQKYGKITSKEAFEFKGEWDMPSICGLKIRTVNGTPHVIVTELYQDNPGTSVTYAGRSLAEQICSAKGFDIDHIVYIECNPDTNSKLSFYDEEFSQSNTFSTAAIATSTISSSGSFVVIL